MNFGALFHFVSAVYLASACGSSSSGGGSGSSGATSSGATSSGATSGGSGSSGSSSGGQTEGGSPSGPCSVGATLTTLPACPAPAATSINVPSGCVPTVDGTYHSGEWGDAACITVGQDPVYVKYAGSTLYLAWSMKPTCGCPAQLAFNTDGATSLDSHQIDLAILDDPFGATGDATEFTSEGGAWTMSASVAAGIVIANPPNQPTPVTYELAIPFSQLGLTTGQGQSVGFGVSHPMGGVWPTGLTVLMTTGQPATPGEWGKLTSSANWQ